MSSNDKKRKWIISLGFNEAEADSFLEFEVPKWKIEALAKVLHPPETEPETAAPVPPAPAPKTKPEVIPTGMFWCPHCNSLHRIASKIGKGHLKYQEG
ncbi:hypothetical protein ES707_14429 [subsurface metagenome]